MRPRRWGRLCGPWEAGVGCVCVWGGRVGAERVLPRGRAAAWRRGAKQWINEKASSASRKCPRLNGLVLISLHLRATRTGSRQLPKAPSLDGALVTDTRRHSTHFQATAPHASSKYFSYSSGMSIWSCRRILSLALRSSPSLLRLSLFVSNATPACVTLGPLLSS